eukprot:gene4012-4647_t
MAESYKGKCSELKEGGYVVLNARPCTITKLTPSQNGEISMVSIKGQDIFAPAKFFVKTCPVDDMIDIPNIIERSLEVRFNLYAHFIDTTDDSVLLFSDENYTLELDLPMGQLGVGFRSCSKKGTIASVTTKKWMEEEGIVSYKENV